MNSAEPLPIHIGDAVSARLTDKRLAWLLRMEGSSWVLHKVIHEYPIAASSTIEPDADDAEDDDFLFTSVMGTAT